MNKIRIKLLILSLILTGLTVASLATQIQPVRAADTYMIIASSDRYSTITPSGAVEVSYGKSQTFRYLANTSGYVISSVLVDNNPVPLTGSYIFSNVIANHTITVKTAITNFTITSSSDSNSLITPSGALQVSYGASQSFNYSAKTGYYISSVLVDGNTSPITGDYTFTNVKSTHTIAVSSLPTPTPSPTPTPTTPPATSSPTPTTAPTAPPSPTPPQTDISTPSPTQSATTPQPAVNPTLQPQTNSPQLPAPTAKPASTAKPTSINQDTPSPSAHIEPNTITQSQASYAGAAAAAVTGVTLAATFAIKKTQKSKESQEDNDF